MRSAVTVLLLAAAFAGCATPATDDTAAAGCAPGPAALRTYWLGPGLSLLPEAPGAGSVPGNGFAAAFLTDDMDEWLSAPFEEGAWLEGEVHLEFWARSRGTPAPIVLGGAPGEGYHFFNQFGSDRSFQPAYTIEHAEAAPLPGSVERHENTMTLPEGGFMVEKGDRLRVLLTSLVMDDASGGGHDILFGGDTPSRVTFAATCYPERDWVAVGHAETAVAVPANQGLLLGAVPATEGVNRAVVPFTLLAETGRLTVSLEQTGSVGPKDDMDLVLVDDRGEQLWSIGSPYSDESGTLWEANLAALFPPGGYRVHVESYSGKAYEGVVTVVQESAAALGPSRAA